MIQIENLTKKFDDHVALSRVNLSVSSGSVFGLVGGSLSAPDFMIKLIQLIGG